MTREEIEKAAAYYAYNRFSHSVNAGYETIFRCKLDFIEGTIFMQRYILEKKRDAYIDRIGYDPEHKDLENWNLQIDLLNKKIEEL